MPVDPREKEYVRTIERRFLELCGRVILSSADFSLLRTWYTRGLPAQFVVEAIEDVFAGAARHVPPIDIQSIAYCRRTVENRWRDRVGPDA